MSAAPVTAERVRPLRGAHGVSTMLRSPLVLVTVVVVTWFIAAFLLWPNLNLLRETFFPDGRFSGGALEKLVSSERAMQSLANSFMLAIALSVAANVVGIFIVLVTRYFDVAGARLLWLGYATTFIYGGIVLAAGYKFVYGENGIVTGVLMRLLPGLGPDWFTGFWAVLFTMTLATTTNHMLFVSAALAKVDQQTIEAAKNMGAGTWTILWRVVLPMLRPVLFAVTILAFLTGLGALSAPQVLGGREFQTIAPMVLTFSSSQSSRDLAALLALVLVVLPLVPSPSTSPPSLDDLLLLAEAQSLESLPPPDPEALPVPPSLRIMGSGTREVNDLNGIPRSWSRSDFSSPSLSSLKLEWSSWLS